MSHEPDLDPACEIETGHPPGTPEPLVGIGVPVFNGARHLPQALDSLLAQSLEDFEIVISDNASTDETPAICRAYAARDPRIRYFRQPANRGAPGNWNFTARRARGKYFKWASSNDFVAPTALERCVRVLEDEPGVVLAFGSTHLVDAGGALIEVYAGDLEVMQPAPSARFQHACERIALNNAISGVVRRQALLSTGLIRPYPASDIVLMAELALRGGIRLIAEPTLYRRADAGSMSSRLSRLDLLKLHDPQAGGRELIVARKHWDLLRIALAAPGLTLAERSKCLAIAGRHLRWSRRQILREILGRWKRGAAPQRLGDSR